MGKVKKKIKSGCITACIECYNKFISLNSYGYLEDYCEETGKEIYNISSIPDWCLLEDCKDKVVDSEDIKIPSNVKNDLETNYNTGLLDDEQEVMDCITEAWNKFLKLEQQHPEDVKEFGYAVHLMQRLLAIRIVRRIYPDGWYKHMD